ncbi:serine O-acetyltransferase [Prosthecodimorpha staleyi]|uniref:Serine acetyltransferase n=1 Tax=Prosthecodimorpha staleyi TaxID=2840188 RepID=A0A947D4W8_9HYPH|nr:serine O-acetyltransferase [Prosthecodimorpha staleyi]MBT9290393.1 serine O-acetyltransferase [Prosthecodimorpha staleyi]
MTRSNRVLKLVAGAEPEAGPADPLWGRLRGEAIAALQADPALDALMFHSILGHASFESAVADRLSVRLATDTLPYHLLQDVFLRAFAAEPSIGEAIRADLQAVVERDPAAGRLIEPFIFFKGFAAIQTHRIAHWLWSNRRRDLALFMQSRSSEVYQTDIHPAVPIGRGIFLDHASGLVIGETAVIEDDVSILQNVTLGGTGTGAGDRHPKIRRGVMIGAGARILGPVEIGAYSRIAAGSVVTQPVPAHSTAVGIPARIIPHAVTLRPAQSMDQTLAGTDYDGFTYAI